MRDPLTVGVNFPEEDDVFGSNGLRTVRDDDLVNLLRAIHRGELTCPITRRGLGEAGLLRLGDELEHLRGLDDKATIAVIVAVLAERRQLSR
ncbi:MAG: hypothetical protein KTR31_07050 [Myxococcales bacterium]|nr:hypothetical protein [Myxococcales bacterium]